MKEFLKREIKRPPFRKLRGYAFDPVTSLDLEMVDLNQITFKVVWENDLKPGPEGEYIKVVDRDPASNAVYEPVDLNDPFLLATDGLAPSETNPQFHQQMVYAVAMTTIKQFEKAMGRKVTWSPVEWYSGGKKRYDFAEKLYIYPHALRDQNAYYSPDRKALLFGYFNATPVKPDVYLPGGIVYTCLSHDIVAHETTHALLDGMYSRFMESTNPDVSAFHEGFSDIIALFLHFTYPEIVKNQIKKVRGGLDTENLLAKLAVEFGQATGEYSALRDAIGKMGKKKWERRQPNVKDYETNFECHDRGALLVSAIFDAFLSIYQNRTADLVRLATGGTGVLPTGEIHPDLVNRLANEASKSANHVLSICIRALDYCPPVDLTYGDYLRALITADAELVSNDTHNYRIAFVNAFRKRGIFPENLPNLSVETLAYNNLEDETAKNKFNARTIRFLKEFKEKLAYINDRKEIFSLTQSFIKGDPQKDIKGFHEEVFGKQGIIEDVKSFEQLTGLVFGPDYRSLGIGTSKTYKAGPSVEIHSLRILNRVGPDGNMLNQIVMTLSQRCTVYVYDHPKTGETIFEPVLHRLKKHTSENTFTFRGGCTLIFDLNTLTLKHAIRKPIQDLDYRKQHKYKKLKLNLLRVKMQYRCQLDDLVDEIGFAPLHKEMTEQLAQLHTSKNQSYE